MIKDVVFICGLGGDAGMTYVPELKKFCESKKWNFYAPSMPSFEDGITYEKYETSFENLLKTKPINLRNCLIIGQSAGTNFTVKYLASKNLEIGAYISVSGFSGEADRDLSVQAKQKLSIIKSFYPTKEEYQIFKDLPFDKYSVFGGRDCFFTVDNLNHYAELIGAKKYYDEGGVHCTISENVTEHKLLHKVIKENF